MRLRVIIGARFSESHSALAAVRAGAHGAWRPLSPSALTRRRANEVNAPQPSSNIPSERAAGIACTTAVTDVGSAQSGHSRNG